MKIRSILLGTVAGVALAGTATAGQLPGWYIGLEGGANWVNDVDASAVLGGGTTIFGSASFDTGWAVLATVGYSFHNHFRIEGEIGYRHNEIDSTTNTTIPVAGTGTGDLNELSLMANVLYDIRLGERLVLTLGAGLGADRAELESGATSLDEWSFAYQGIAGLGYNLNRKTQLTLNYRYFKAGDITWDVGPAPAAITFDDVTKHTVTLGLRYSFGHEEVEAPPPPPAPMPPPPPNKHFIIFFGFNKCNITAEADSVLSEAAAAAKATGSASVTIVGHTDTVGSNAYNQKLSECRANAAKSNLAGKGVPDGAISTSGKGETELMVQTGDGVKEPQNRRATVDVN
jgi:OOP family OmpA-OmpF porin